MSRNKSHSSSGLKHLTKTGWSKLKEVAVFLIAIPFVLGVALLGLLADKIDKTIDWYKKNGWL